MLVECLLSRPPAWHSRHASPVSTVCPSCAHRTSRSTRSTPAPLRHVAAAASPSKSKLPAKMPAD